MTQNRPSAKLRVMTLLGTRPELIKMSRICAELDRHVDHYVVHSGQNYNPELSTSLLDDLGMRAPDRWLNAAGSTPMHTVAATLAAFDATLEDVRPEAVVIYGDTDTGLAALAAKRRKIPIFHLEAGNRCFDQTVPEEINRKLIDHLSDINLVLSEHARRHLLAENFPADRIFRIGSPMMEVLDFHREKIGRSDILQRLNLSARGYILVSVHRAETVDDPNHLRSALASAVAVAEKHQVELVMSTHPRTRKRIEALGAGADDFPRIRFLPAFLFTDYVHLQLNALCVLSDSGSLTEEASILDLPAVALRRQHERLEGMDEGTVVMAGIDPERVVQAVDLVIAQRPDGKRATRLIPDYDTPHVSRHVTRLIVSYVDFVRRVVWGNTGEGASG